MADIYVFLCRLNVFLKSDTQTKYHMTVEKFCFYILIRVVILLISSWIKESFLYNFFYLIFFLAPQLLYNLGISMLLNFVIAGLNITICFKQYLVLSFISITDHRNPLYHFSPLTFQQKTRYFLLFQVPAGALTLKSSLLSKTCVVT